MTKPRKKMQPGHAQPGIKAIWDEMIMTLFSRRRTLLYGSALFGGISLPGLLTGGVRLARRGLAAPAIIRATSLDQGPSGGCFPYGVASGDPDDHSVVLWTRLGSANLVFGARPRLPEQVTLDWELARDSNMRNIVRSGQIVVSHDTGYCAHVVVDGLEDGHSWWYRFSALGDRSPTGRACTLPKRGKKADRLKLAVASCAHYEFGHYAAYDRIADELPDLVAFLGDYIYEHNTPPRRRHEAVRSYDAPLARTLEDYRWRYAIQKMDRALQRAHEAAPWISIWDDHEVEDDYSGEYPAARNETMSDFVLRRAAAYRAWFENMPVRPSTRRNGAYQIYHRLHYGDLASIDCLDGRQYRSQQPCPNGAAGGEGHMESDLCRDLLSPGRNFLGRSQENWLYAQLTQHDHLWTIIAQDLMVASLRAPDKQSGHYRYWTDSWDGFQSARDRLMDALRRTEAPSPVIFSGDYHAHFASEIRQRAHDPRSPVIATEFLGTSITSPGPSYAAITSVLPDNPDIHFFDSRQRGYVLANFDRNRVEIAMKGLEDVRDPFSPARDMARFTVERGKMKLLSS